MLFFGKIQTNPTEQEKYVSFKEFKGNLELKRILLTVLK
jgi:hypothetical protein